MTHRVVSRLPFRHRLTFVRLSGAPLDATLTQYGGGITQVHVEKPIDYTIVFTKTQARIFLRRRRDLVRALVLLKYLPRFKDGACA